jgi:hypothetical protein
MPETPKSTSTVANQRFTTSQVVTGVLVEPSVGLYQPVYLLTEAEFMRLRQTSPVLSTSAGAVISFGLVYTLPVVANHILTAAPFKAVDIWVSGITFGLGIVLALLSFVASSEHRTLVSRIKTHFRENPGQHEIRQGHL